MADMYLINKENWEPSFNSAIAALCELEFHLKEAQIIAGVRKRLADVVSKKGIGRSFWDDNQIWKYRQRWELTVDCDNHLTKVERHYKYMETLVQTLADVDSFQELQINLDTWQKIRHYEAMFNNRHVARRKSR